MQKFRQFLGDKFCIKLRGYNKDYKIFIVKLKKKIAREKLGKPKTIFKKRGFATKKRLVKPESTKRIIFFGVLNSRHFFLY